MNTDYKKKYENLSESKLSGGIAIGLGIIILVLTVLNIIVFTNNQQLQNENNSLNNYISHFINKDDILKGGETL